METVNQEVNATEETKEQKTFTQEEIDQIIGARLAKIRATYSDYEDLKAKAAKFDEIEEASKTELQKMTERADALQAELDGMKKARDLRDLRDKVAKETGVPANLLSGETEEACLEQAKAIMEFAKPGAYPSVKDAGEVRHTGKRTTKEQFAEWAKENL